MFDILHRLGEATLALVSVRSNPLLNTLNSFPLRMYTLEGTSFLLALRLTAPSMNQQQISQTVWAMGKIGMTFSRLEVSHLLSYH